MKTLEVTAAIICNNGQILVCQRPVHKNCGLLWEFPGGKIEAGETGEQCIVRECQEELGITLSVDQKLTDITYEYTDRVVHLHFFLCNIVSGVPEKKEHNAFAWIRPNELEQYELCPADARMIEKMGIRALQMHIMKKESKHYESWRNTD